MLPFPILHWLWILHGFRRRTAHKAAALILLSAGCLLVLPATGIAQNSAVDEFQERANTLERAVGTLDRLTSAEDLDDQSLASARIKFENLLLDIDQLRAAIEAESNAISARIDQIGPPPDGERATEPLSVTETRARLNQEKATLAATASMLTDLTTRVQNEINEIARRRQEAFAEALSKRTVIDKQLITEALDGLVSEFRASIRLFRDWLAFVFTAKFWQVIGSTLISLALALFLSYNFRRLFGVHLDRRVADPDYFTRVFTAFWATLLPSAATAIFLGATYALFKYFDLLPPLVGQIALALILVIIGIVFAWNLCRAIFAPRASNWQLVDLSEAAASRMFWLVFALFVVNAIDYFLQSLTNVLSGPVALTALQGAIAAVLIGALLIMMALIRWDRAVSPGGEAIAPDHPGKAAPVRKRHRWPRWVTVPLFLAGAVIILSALIGYVGFARFVAQQVIVTGAIIAVMAIGIIAAKELASEGVLATTKFGKLLATRGYEPYRIEQASLIAGGLFFIFVLALGIPAILMQWGTQFSEITLFVQRAFAGFQVGNIRISLSGILIGLVIFALVLGITRLFQQWLSRSVFPRSRVDPGVSNSIRAAIGYIGFAIAVLLAITSAGLDLSNLAIIAGALSLGIGFGLQNIVSNFVSGLILLAERPIKVGDWVSVGGVEGTVKKISVRATEVETFQRQSIIVPNSELINQQVGNWTLQSTTGRVDVMIGIAYDSDARLAERLLYEIADSHAMVAKRPSPSVWFRDFGASSLDFTLRMFLHDINNVVTVETEIRFEILRRFAEAGIEIPFPQQDVHLKLPDGVAAGLAAESGKTPPVKHRRRTKGDRDATADGDSDGAAGADADAE